jgi:chromosome segregation ATPase
LSIQLRAAEQRITDLAAALAQQEESALLTQQENDEEAMQRQAELSELRVALEAMRAAHYAATTQLSEAVESFRAREAAWALREAALEADLASAHEVAAQKDEALAILQRAHDDAQGRIAELESARDSSARQLASQETMSAAARGELHALHAQVESLQSDLARAEVHLRSKSNEVDLLARQAQELRDELVDSCGGRSTAAAAVAVARRQVQQQGRLHLSMQPSSIPPPRARAVCGPLMRLLLSLQLLAMLAALSTTPQVRASVASRVLHYARWTLGLDDASFLSE